MNKSYKKITTCKLLLINKNKFDVLKDFKHWESKQIKRCVKLLCKGYSYKEVYNSFNSKVKSIYKSKITNCAVNEYLSWSKRNQITRKQDTLYRGQGGSKGWIYKSQIKSWDITEETDKMFQVYTTIVLPFEIKGKTELSLVAQIDKHFYDKHSVEEIYKKGFQLCLDKKTNSAYINLVQKVEQESQETLGVKSIYADAYGSLHICSMNNIETGRKEIEHKIHDGIENVEDNKEEFHQCLYGISKASKDCVKLIDKMASMKSTETFNEDLYKLKLKLKTRANRYFETMKSQYNKVLFVRVIDNSSKIVNFIQEVYENQFEKLCKYHNVKFEVVYYSRKDLESSAIWCARKSERQEVQSGNKKLSNMFKSAVALKDYFKNKNAYYNVKLRIGIKRLRNSSKMFLDKTNKKMMHLGNRDSSEYDYEEPVFV